MSTLTKLVAGIDDPAQPFITYYDLGTGERIELSATTTANWVAKTSNFLVEDLDAEAGTRLRIALPSHWETYVWLLAAWQVGCVVTDVPADIAVVGPDLDPLGPEPLRVALSLRPLGARFTEPPADHIDFNAEVLGHSDHFVPMDPPTSDSAAVNVNGRVLTHGEAIEAFPARGGRLLLAPGDLFGDVGALIAIACGGGSLVLVSGGSAEQRESIAADERAKLW